MTTNAQPEKTKCLSHQPGRNCPLDNKDADPNTFCEAYKQGDGYTCNAAAKDDPIEDEWTISTNDSAIMSFKGLTIKEKRQIAESVVPFDLSFNRRCPGIFASPSPCIGFDESNYRECKFDSIETICRFSELYRELEDINKNRKYLTYDEKREISLAQDQN